MCRNVEVKLEWEQFNFKEDMPPKAGIYMVIGMKKGKGPFDGEEKKLLDIGETENALKRFKNHGRENLWEEEKPKGGFIYYKFAYMPLEEHDETDRQIVECCLRGNHPPPVGKKCNEGYNRPDTVKIINKGLLEPLRGSYSCGD